MEELVRNAVVLGALVGLALVPWRSRWRVPALGLALVVGLPLAWGLQALAGSFAAGSPHVGLLSLLAWVAFTRLAAAAGGPWLRGPAWLVAPALGAFIGDWGAALLLAPLAPSPGIAARWVLGALAGGWLALPGTAASSAGLGGEAPVVLAGVLLLIAAPPGRVDQQGSPPVTALVVTVGVAAALFQDHLPFLLGGGALVLAARGARAPGLLRDTLGLALLGGLVWLTRHAGVLHELRWGLEWLAGLGGPGLAGVCVATALAASVGSEVGVGLLLHGALDTTHLLDQPMLPTALVTGLVLGGVGPLVWTGLWRHGLGRWALGLVVAALWFVFDLV